MRNRYNLALANHQRPQSNSSSIVQWDSEILFFLTVSQGKTVPSANFIFLHLQCCRCDSLLKLLQENDNSEMVKTVVQDPPKLTFIKTLLIENPLTVVRIKGTRKRIEL